MTSKVNDTKHQNNIEILYSIQRPESLINFWTLRVGTYLRWALVKFSQFTAIVIIFCNKMRCSKAEFKILLENFITILTKENLVSFFVTEETSPFQSHCQKAKDNFICWKVVGVGTYIYLRLGAY